MLPLLPPIFLSSVRKKQRLRTHRHDQQGVFFLSFFVVTFSLSFETSFRGFW